jgi:hypothetical protein
MECLMSKAEMLYWPITCIDIATIESLESCTQCLMNAVKLSECFPSLFQHIKDHV